MLHELSFSTVAGTRLDLCFPSLVKPQEDASQSTQRLKLPAHTESYNNCCKIGLLKKRTWLMQPYKTAYAKRFPLAHSVCVLTYP